MNVKRLLIAGIVAFCLSVIGNVSAADDNAERPFLHPLFSDHAVLQRDLAIPVWGWARPNEKVTVTINSKATSATAGADGRWQVKIGPFPAGGPHSITVAGSQTVTLNDILFGDVWICSGQSNMEMGIGACNAPNDIAQADYPQIRLLTVPKLIALKPVASAPCSWLVCSPQTVTQGVWAGFSAVGYYFGRELQHELKIPIGLIHTSWGGTVAEAWTSAEGLRPLSDFKDRLDQVLEQASASKPSPDEFTRKFENWYQANDPGTTKGWFKPDTDVSSWKSVAMPQPIEAVGLPEFDGIVWFHREFELPAAWVGKDLTLNLGPIDDFDTTWVNGVQVGQKNRYDQERVYRVPASALRAGRNVIAIRDLDTGGFGGLTGKAEQLRIAPAGDAQKAPISLAGAWQMRETSPFAGLPAPPQVTDPNNPNVTTVLYNGMIAPVAPFAIKGAIWYQGESNAGRARQYRELLPAMIRDWRHSFGVGDFPFYIVQLAAFQATFPEPRDNDWAELREAQALTTRSVPNTGLAVAIDIGDAADIHPKDKRDVGRRLALAALAKTYGKKVESSGPWYKSMKAQGDAISLSFDHVGGGLEAKGDKLAGFAVAGADQKFVWADAKIDGGTIVVSSPKIAQPVAVRYAWDINPVCNLYNKAGLPAVPFRTDDWPMITQNNK